MPVHQRILNLDVGLMSGLDIKLRLMPDLDVRLGYKYRFSVVSR